MFSGVQQALEAGGADGGHVPNCVTGPEGFRDPGQLDGPEATPHTSLNKFGAVCPT